MQGLVYKETQVAQDATKLSVEERLYNLTTLVIDLQGKVQMLTQQLAELNQRTASMRRFGVVAGGLR